MRKSNTILSVLHKTNTPYAIVAYYQHCKVKHLGAKPLYSIIIHHRDKEQHKNWSWIKGSDMRPIWEKKMTEQDLAFFKKNLLHYNQVLNTEDGKIYEVSKMPFQKYYLKHTNLEELVEKRKNKRDEDYARQVHKIKRVHRQTI